MLGVPVSGFVNTLEGVLDLGVNVGRSGCGQRHAIFAQESNRALGLKR